VSRFRQVSSATSVAAAGVRATLTPMTEPRDATEGHWAPLVDVSDVSLAKMLAEEDGPIGRATRRVVESLDDPAGVISAFGSFVGS
jgi:FXSXX-COOH protein